MKLCGRYLFFLPVLFLLGCPQTNPTPGHRESVESTTTPDIVIKKIIYKNAKGELGWFGVAKTPEGWLVFDGAGNYTGNPGRTNYVPDKDHGWIKGFDEKS